MSHPTPCNLQSLAYSQIDHPRDNSASRQSNPATPSVPNLHTSSKVWLHRRFHTCLTLDSRRPLPSHGVAIFDNRFDELASILQQLFLSCRYGVWLRQTCFLEKIVLPDMIPSAAMLSNCFGIAHKTSPAQKAFPLTSVILFNVIDILVVMDAFKGRFQPRKRKIIHSEINFCIKLQEGSSRCLVASDIS